MIRNRLVEQRLAFLFFLGVILFNYPLLAVVGHLGGVAGLPQPFAWLMGVWLALIALLAWVVERRPATPRGRPGEHP